MPVHCSADIYLIWFVHLPLTQLKGEITFTSIWPTFSFLLGCYTVLFGGYFLLKNNYAAVMQNWKYHKSCVLCQFCWQKLCWCWFFSLCNYEADVGLEGQSLSPDWEARTWHNSWKFSCPVVGTHVPPSNLTTLLFYSEKMHKCKDRKIHKYIYTNTNTHKYTTQELEVRLSCVGIVKLDHKLRQFVWNFRQILGGESIKFAMY